MYFDFSICFVSLSDVLQTLFSFIHKKVGKSVPKKTITGKKVRESIHLFDLSFLEPTMDFDNLVVDCRRSRTNDPGTVLGTNNDVLIDSNIDGSYDRSTGPGPTRNSSSPSSDEAGIEVVDEDSSVASSALQYEHRGGRMPSDEADDDDEGKTSSSFSGCRKMTVCSVICFAVLLVIIVVSTTTAKKKNEQRAQQTETVGSYSQARTPAEEQSGCTGLDDTYAPKLDFLLRVHSASGLFTPDEVSSMEAAIMEAYNEVSLGCNGDDYNRYMYGVDMIHQNIDVYHDTNGGSTTVLEALVGTQISCTGCWEDNCFASEYPSGNYKRILHAGYHLSGAEVLAKMQQKFSSIESFDSIISATISVDTPDGGVATNQKSIRNSDLQEYLAQDEAEVADGEVADGGDGGGGVSIYSIR